MQKKSSAMDTKFSTLSCPLMLTIFLLIKRSLIGRILGNKKQLWDLLNHLYACVTYLAFKILLNAKNCIREFRQKLTGSPVMRLF